MQRNPEIPFTYKYSQPEDYHFSIDSIEMPWRVFHEISARVTENTKALDLCAGCGVLGFELNFHVPKLQDIDFLEIQSIYKDHFEHNRRLALERNHTGNIAGEPQFKFLNFNYEKLLTDQYKNQYDLVLCNPPYFQPEQGKLSNSEFKNRCRFFMDSNFETLIFAICHTLKQQGEAFLLLRELEDHGIDMLRDLRRLIKDKLECESLGEVRGTLLLRLFR